MNDDAIPTGLPAVARLFPLPNLVLFPGVVQGLHIFEVRYRQMMADALASDSLVALVLLCSGWEEEYEGSPAIESVACLGRIVWHETLADGRYNLRLRGITRIRIREEIPTNKLYRTARVEVIADAAAYPVGKLTQLRQNLADAVLPQFDDDSTGQHLRELFESDRSLGQLCDVLAYALPLPVELKQAMLAEPDVGVRAVSIADAFRAAAARAGHKFPPEFSSN